MRVVEAEHTSGSSSGSDSDSDSFSASNDSFVVPTTQVKPNHWLRQDILCIRNESGDWVCGPKRCRVPFGLSAQLDMCGVAVTDLRLYRTDAPIKTITVGPSKAPTNTADVSLEENLQLAKIHRVPVRPKLSKREKTALEPVPTAAPTKPTVDLSSQDYVSRLVKEHLASLAKAANLATPP